MALLAIPQQPSAILTPPALKTPDEQTLALIQKKAEELIKSDETFSVTFSPMHHPAAHNFLFTLHPHYWKTPEGVWERRDAQRNPYAAIPEGQKQLEGFSMAIRDLSLAIRYLADEQHDLKIAAKDRAAALIKVFFIDPQTRMRPEVLYSQCIPGQEPLKGNSLFIISSRFLILVSQYLSFLRLDPELEGQVKEWVRQHVQWMKHSNQGIECARRDDNKAVWYQAVLATHLALVDPPQAHKIAVGFFTKSIETYPKPADFFKQTSSKTTARHPALFLLEPIFILAEIALRQEPERVGSYSPESPQSPVSPIYPFSPSPFWPPANPLQIMTYLETVKNYARTIRPGPIELSSEDDHRYFPKLDLFDNLLDRFHHRSIVYGIQNADESETYLKTHRDGSQTRELVKDRDVGEGFDGQKIINGEGWEGGWSEFMQISWGLV